MGGIVGIFVAFVLISASGDRARAELVISFQQVGGDVVNTAGGALDATGLVGQGTSAPFGASPYPYGHASVLLGPTSRVSGDLYATDGGPTSFGSGPAADTVNSGVDADSIVVQVGVASVPAPSRAVLAGIGSLIGAGWMLRKSRRSAHRA